MKGHRLTNHSWLNVCGLVTIKKPQNFATQKFYCIQHLRNYHILATY